MPIAHECKCGLVTPVPESQGGKRIRCKGCGTISLVICPEVLAPDPVPVPAGKSDSAPPPPPRRPFKYRRQLSREEERADYPRTGGVIDWRKVHDGDEHDYHHDPVPPDPQTRHIVPDATPARRALWITAGVLSVLLALVGVASTAWGVARVAYGAFPVFAAGVLLIGRGLRGKWY